MSGRVMPNLLPFAQELIGMDLSEEVKKQTIEEMKVNDAIVNEEFMKEVRCNFLL